MGSFQISRRDVIFAITQMYEGKAVKSILNLMGVDVRAFHKELDNDPILLREYEMAQRCRAEMMVEEIMTIADEENDVLRAKLKVDARKWYASKMLPRKYGDRIDLNVTHTVDIAQALNDAKCRAKIVHIKEERSEIFD